MIKNLLLATALCLSVGTAKAITLSTGIASDVFGPGNYNDDASNVFDFLKDVDPAFTTSLTQTKHDSDSSGTTGGLTIGVNGGPSGTSGTWQYSGAELIWAFVVKGGNDFKVYYNLVGSSLAPIPTFDGDGLLQYDWFTGSNGGTEAALIVGKDNNPGISHGAVYWGGDRPTTEVPEPATAAIALGLIGGLAFLRRRK